MNIKNRKSQECLKIIHQEKKSGDSSNNSSVQSIFKEQENQIKFLKQYNMIHALNLGSNIRESISSQSNLSNKKIKISQSKIQSLKMSISTNASLRELQIKQKAIKSQQARQISLRDFKVGKKIGSGRFSEVFVAKNIKTGFVCGLKRIKKSQILQQNMLNQLIRQIKIQLFCDHPNLLKLYGMFSNQQYIFLIMQLCSDGQLYNHIEKKRIINKNIGCFSQKQVANYVKQIAQGIRYIHTLNIIHRDLKPENILIQRGLLKICDFGWAVNIKMDLRSTFCGTPLYVSPQVLKGEKYDQKIDLWAIGIMAYELFYGDIPFHINNECQLYKIIKDQIIFVKNLKISDALKSFIELILKKDPKQRLSVGMVLQHTFLKNISI